MSTTRKTTGTAKPRTATCGIAVAAALALTIACGAPKREGTGGAVAAPESVRWQTYPLAARGSFGRDVLSIDGWSETRWQRWDMTPVPVVVVADGTTLRFAVDELAGARVRGGYALAARPGSDHAVTANFRVAVTTADGGHAVLFERRLTSAAGDRPHRFETEVPGDLGGQGEISFDVALPEGADRGRALWLDPEVALPRRSTSPAAGAVDVLIVTADTTRRDALGSFGGAAATPALDSLAADGVRLDQVYSLGYGTTPSHASLFTGSHPREHGVYDNQTVLRDEVTTLAEVLRDAGYETAAFVGAKPVSRSLGLDQGFLRYDDVFGPDAEARLGRFAHYERRADRTTDRFLAWLEDTSGPFAAWVHFFDPHQPYAPPGGTPDGEPPELNRVFTEADGGPRYVRLSGPDAEALDGIALPDFDRAARRRYRAEIEAMDEQLGRILAALRERGSYRSTLIVFVSDHGENFVDRGPRLAYRHGGLFGEVTHLATIIKLPGSQPAGGATGVLIANADLACLAVDVAGLDASEDWSCRSFLALLTDGTAGRSFRSHLVLEGSSRQEIAVRTPVWSYREALPATSPEVLAGIGYDTGSREMLFDLRSDPGERDNVIAAPEHHAELARLRAIARDFQARDAAVDGRTVESKAHLEALKALGYID